MKRLHLHIGVEDLDAAIKFYNAVFGAEPVKLKPDYARWMVDNPRVNFAISTRPHAVGLNHLGIQVDEEAELAEIRERMKTAQLAVFDEGETVCCYAHSDKSWVLDPAGIPWETYRTMEDAEFYAGPAPRETEAAACCTPERSDSCCDGVKTSSSCCV